MTRHIVLTWLLLGTAGWLHAAEFVGAFEGFDQGGRIIVSGKAYPIKPDIEAIFGNKLLPVDQLPSGTDVRFELGQHQGVSSVVRLQITGHDGQLDSLSQDY